MPLTKPRTDLTEDFDLSELTLAERLFLWRHRQRAADGRVLGRTGGTMSQPEAAAALGLNPDLYHRIENGAEPHVAQRCSECGSVVAVEDRRALFAAIELAKNVAPTPGELCLIARRRSGLSLSRACAELGVTRPTYHAWERGADPRLVKWWEGRGFRFK